MPAGGTLREPPDVLLALDAGVRETGWAVLFRQGAPKTGVIQLRARPRVPAATRVCQLVRRLDQLVQEWEPTETAYSQPSGIHWPVPALELLENALTAWSQRHRLPLYPYSAQQVRSAIVGHPNASRDRLAYEVMVRFGLIGQGKTTHEWEALAVGHYHLTVHVRSP